MWTSANRAARTTLAPMVASLRSGAGQARSRLRTTESVRGLIRNSSRTGVSSDVPGCAPCTWVALFRSTWRYRFPLQRRNKRRSRRCSTCAPSIPRVTRHSRVCGTSSVTYPLACHHDLCVSPCKAPAAPCRYIAVELQSGFARNSTDPKALQRCRG
jgi:hypothetical protein